MSSINFQKILKEELGRSYSENEGTQSAEIRAAMSVKAGSLTAMLAARAEQGLLPQDIASFEDAADEYVAGILRLMAETDVDRLFSNSELLSEKSTKKKKIKSSGGLRDSRGRLIKLTTLERLLNLTLVRYTQELMGTEGRLVNRTGRLANSGVVSGMDSNNDNLSVYFSYMTFPYAVFENGPKSDGGRRSPASLFSDAIHLALRDLLSPKSTVVINPVFKR